MRRWEDVAICASYSEPKRVADRLSAERLVVADESRKNGKACGVRACPTVRPSRVRVKWKHRSRSCLPPPARPSQCVKLVKNPIVAVNDQHVTVAVRIRIVAGGSPLDPLLLRLCLLRDRIWAWIALIGVVERHRHTRLRCRHDDVGKAVDWRRDVAAVAAEVGLQLSGRADVINEGSTVRINRSTTDVRVQPVV